MTVSNPLIKELKGWTRKLTECGKEIDDENRDLLEFCRSLEKCLQKGVLTRLAGVGFSKTPDAWYWMEEFAEKNSSSCSTFSLVVDRVKANTKLQTATGRLRLLIRTCLTRKCLHAPVEMLVRTPLLAAEFYATNSILGDDILGEILLSVLLQCGKLNFKLNLRNASFLDETLEMPECIALELVPCKSLGISICFTKGKALIVNLDRNSVAAEDDIIQVGDVLDEINGNVVTSSNTQGKLRKIMKRATGKPVTLHIIKHSYKQRQELYGPIMHLIRSSGIESTKKILKTWKPGTSGSGGGRRDSEETSGDSRPDSKTLNAGFSMKYCGSLFIGSEGDVKQIERAILQLLRSGEVKLVPVQFECLEIGIRVTREADDTVICKQTYMEISSCGRTGNIPDYFAFIAGDSPNCSVATKFDAYVFYHQRAKEVQTILQSLSQGFQRTHFAV